MLDFGASGAARNGHWRSSVDLLDTTYAGPAAVSFPPGTNAYSSSAVLDFGLQPVDPDARGWSVGWAVDSDAPACSFTEPDPALLAPSPITYFDFGGYSLRAAVAGPGACEVGGFDAGVPQAAAVLASASGEAASFTGAGTPGSPLLPSLGRAYTFVTVGPDGAVVYVDGTTWATFPAVRWEPEALGARAPLRFFGGNLAASRITLLDLQIYDYALSAAQVAVVSRGSDAC